MKRRKMKSKNAKKRYAIVGTGSRSYLYIRAIISTFRDETELCGMCDTNQVRLAYVAERMKKEYGDTAPALDSVPCYTADRFDTMLGECRPDCVIVCSIDRTHHRYICAALRRGCEVITEKPLTIDEGRCQEILDTVKQTGGTLRVAFNYRYSPRNARVKELLSEKIIGDITHVHFEWLLDTRHGADYFRRWHRDKRNSGGLLVHKATHHFDLVNWWIDSAPQTVYARGRLAFYGKENAEARGVNHFYSRVRGAKNAQNDPFAIDFSTYEPWKRMYLDAEDEDGYYRDQSVFGDGISIEDTMGVMVSYRNGVVLTYSCIAYSPYEGYNVMFNGTKGRLEMRVVEREITPHGKESVDTEDGERGVEYPRLVRTGPEIVLQHFWSEPQPIDYEKKGGGHGGGDPLMLTHLFTGAENDTLGQAAGYMDGAWSILTGIAANRSIARGQPVSVESLIRI
jgi:predicted dehydrogenase